MVPPDSDTGRTLLSIIWTLITLAIVVVVSRLWTQAKVTRSFGLSDVLVTISLVVVVSLGALYTVQYHYGWGRHFIYLDGYQRKEAAKWNLVGSSFGIFGSACGRTSFIITMIQLFGTTPWRRSALWTLFAAQFIINSAALICLYVQCSNVAMLWDKSIPNRKCWDPSVRTNIGYSHSSFNAATDLFLTCLPATMLWNLQMKPHLKAGLAVLLGLSLFAFIACIVKIVYLAAPATQDSTYTTAQLSVWITLEATFVMIAASVPLVRPLFRHLANTRQRHSASFDDKNLYSKVPSSGGTGSRTVIMTVSEREDEAKGRAFDDVENLRGAGAAGYQRAPDGVILLQLEYSVTYSMDEKKGKEEQRMSDAEIVAS